MEGKQNERMVREQKKACCREKEINHSPMEEERIDDVVIDESNEDAEFHSFSLKC